MQKPSVGRVAHYVSFGSKGGEYAPACRAAIITQVQSRDFVGLAVLNPSGMFFHEDVEYHEGDQAVSEELNLPPSYHGGTWHWPERVD